MIYSPIESDEELERQSCNGWEASDEQKWENGSRAEKFEQELQALHSKWEQIYKYGGQDSNCPLSAVTGLPIQLPVEDTVHG